MKNVNKIFTVALVVIAMTAIAAPAQDDSITVVDAKQKNLFVFKINRDLVGSEVEVYHSSGEMVTSMTLNKKKAIIDFCDVKFGVYTIKVVKDGTVVEEFTYNKELILSQVVR